MADEPPYLVSQRNLDPILEKIKSAGTPPKFNREFLKTTLGFTASNDRGVINILKALGFLNADSVPTARYGEFRQSMTSGRALALGLKEGWAPVFLADQQAHTRSSSELKEIFKNTTGKTEAVAEKMAATFKALAQKADFTAVTPAAARNESEADKELGTSGQGGNGHAAQATHGGVALHNDIHIHLPPSSDVAVFTAIFKALREELLD